MNETIPQEQENDLLIFIKKTCKNYIDDTSCIYKLCEDQYCYQWIIIMRKLPDSRTNESRNKVVDCRYAKFEADKLLVLNIINVHYGFTTKTIKDGSSIKIIKRTCEDNKSIFYTIGETINTKSLGIQYFKSIEAAYFNRKIPPDYTGLWTEYYDNGNKKSNTYYINGLKMGKCTEYFENGNKESEGEYKNDSRENLWIEWHENGQKKSEGNYEYGKQNGNRIEYDREGNKICEIMMVYGRSKGKYICWYKNGIKKCEGELDINGQIGFWTEWYDNGEKMSEGEYVSDLNLYVSHCSNVKNGNWMYWDKNGIMKHVIYNYGKTTFK
jgi:antitoxin component YwqK of YwqJK toxin-antitoxin module